MRFWCETVLSIYTRLYVYPVNVWFKRHFEALGSLFTSVWSDITFVDDGGREKFLRRFTKRFAHILLEEDQPVDDNIFYPSFCRRLHGRVTRRCEREREIRRIIYTYTRGCDTLGWRVSQEIGSYFSKYGKCTKCLVSWRSCCRQRRKDCSPVRRENALTIWANRETMYLDIYTI